MKKQFNLEYQYQLYLKKVGLTENEMHPEQKMQLRHAFMAGCGQLLLLLRDDITELTEMESIIILQQMLDEAENFFKSSIK